LSYGYGITWLGVGLLALPGLGVAQAAEDAKPERLLTMAVEYPGIALDTPDDVDMNITFYNKGRTDETVEV
jgi:hypothetical protein